MIKGIGIGVILAIALLVGCVFIYFSTLVFLAACPFFGYAASH
jgi:hypothetical protein